ncbi:hypothetical protein [Pseudoxanthomonas sp.]|uniref:hypothetical protein n=1 Tax=Pseudoxanthomonas sp. TaxID=1871049 RepID=UPI0025F685C1|nr:hypothetical protein [Pseudoxanthomonas sp.]
MSADLNDLSAPDRLLKTTAAAAYLDMHPMTLVKWRSCSEPGKTVGPKWTVLATGSIRYSLHELQRFAGLRQEAA